MNAHSASGSDHFYSSRLPGQRDTPTDNLPRSALARLGPCIAFFVMVFASMAAAATVVSEAPLILVGLY
ncbi:MAG: hypothetical protein HYX42_11370 [Polaromonas sp.]|uniref:hypothetical protein n=1 Tax=Polaromonas sp. TaxID=1869339 RepID=UPI0025D90438|nr:hypothetical protein [Polaromonas sp.]MBI2726838.1 hypothetical protein [Polaromonas sp.]